MKAIIAPTKVRVQITITSNMTSNSASNSLPTGDAPYKNASFWIVS